MRARHPRHGPRPAHHRSGERNGALRRPLRNPHLHRPPGRLTHTRLPHGPAQGGRRPGRAGTALGAEPLSIHDTGDHIGDLLVELADETSVRALAPDFAALASCSRRGIIATAAAEDPSRGYDYVSRGFFPRVGIDEDPVTGSAHTALAPFWSARFGRDELTGLQASARSGLVRTSLRGERTLLTGIAVTVVDGELLTTF